MADPLSIAASIAGLISLADIVFTRLIKYKTSVKDAEKELGDLAKEVNLLGGALNSLSRLARALEAGSFDSNLRMHNVEDCSDSLTAMEKELSKIDLTSIRTKLFRPISSDQVREWLDLLSRHKQNINLALSADSMDAMLKLLAKEDEHVEVVKETRRITIRIEKAMEDKRLLEFYVQHNPQHNYDMSLRLRHGRTGLWLTRLPQFRYWLSNPGSRLWLKGIPGAGKTVLAASIIEAALGQSSESIACAFFFCDYKVTATQNIEAIMLAIVYQLGLQNGEAYRLLKYHYEEHHPVNGLPRQPSEAELKLMLHNILKIYSHVHLVIDGLDECGKYTADVVGALAKIPRKSPNVSIALLSRDEEEVRHYLHEDFVSIEVAAHKQDITEYITAEIEERTRNGKLDLHDPELKAHALIRLVDGANGMFRWVACQLDHLSECDSAQECRDALQSLPPTLNETYIRILERIPQKKTRLVQLALHAIAFADPALEIRELQHLLSVPEPGFSLEPRNVIKEDSITKYCSSLIRKSTDGSHFEFSHFSVREFLETCLFPRPELEIFRISDHTSGFLLAVECLKYLLLGNFARLSVNELLVMEETGQRDDDYPLYIRAATRWHHYAYGHWEEPTVEALARSLFDQARTTCFFSWASTFLADQELDVDKGLLIAALIDVNFTTLHMAAALWLPQICSHLLMQGIDANLDSPIGGPLQCAIQGLRSFAYLNSNRAGDNGYWYNQDNSHSMAAATVVSIQNAGGSLQSRCIHNHCGKSLLRLAFSVARQTRTLLLPSLLIKLGATIEEDDVSSAQKLFDDTRMYIRNLQGLQELVESLESHIAQSPGHVRLYSMAWRKAMHLNEEFTRNTAKVNTVISFTLADLTEHAIAATKSGNLLLLRKIFRDPRTNLSNISDGQGGSLLPMALREQPRTQPVAILQSLLEEGFDALKTDWLGKQPMHVWRWELCPEMFDDVARMLADRGATCSIKDSKGRNVLHSQVGSRHLLEAILKFQSPVEVKKAMEATDDMGHTPLALCLIEGKRDSATILAKYSTITSSMVKNSTGFLGLIVRANAETLLDFLPCFNDADICSEGENPLLQLGPDATLSFIRRIKTLYPNVCSREMHRDTVLQAYLQRCLESAKTGGSRYSNLDPAVLDELSILDSSRSASCFSTTVMEGAQATWAMLAAVAVQDRSAFNHVPPWVTPCLTQCPTIINSLLRLGYFEVFEGFTGKSGALPLLDAPLQFNFSSSFKHIRTILWDILPRTKYWSSIQHHRRLVQILGASFLENDVELAELLLKKGVSIHDRPDTPSPETPLESVFKHVRSTPQDQTAKIIDLALAYADMCRLDEHNPDSGCAPIHVLGGGRAEWVVRKLVDRGANPNLRVNSPPHAPPIVHHLFHNAPDCATAIFRSGGDPTLTDDKGFDAALAASFHDAVSFLSDIILNSTSAIINWSSKCSMNIWNYEQGKNLGGLNALHVGAAGGSVGALRFYLKNNLLEDINAKADDDLTPLHLATINGHIRAVAYLCSRGCDVNACTVDGRSPLHFAAKGESMPIARVLLQAGCKPSRDAAGLLPSFYAPKKNKSQAQWFRSSDTNAEAVASMPLPSRTVRKRRHQAFADLCEEAINNGDIEILEDLRQENCSFEMPLNSCKGCSPLIQAIALRRTKIIRWLLQNEADITREVCHVTPRVSAMHMVLKTSELNDLLPECLECYTKGGGHIADADPGLLATAVEAGNVDGLKIVLETLKSLRETTQGSVMPHLSISEALAQVDSDGWSPLHRAAFGGSLKSVEVLLEYGADINAMGPKSHGTPLGCAIRSQKDDGSAIALLLIRMRAKLDYRDCYGQTALLQAVGNDRIDIIKQLLDANADLTVTDFDNSSILDLLSLDSEHSCALFARFVHLGVQIHREESSWYSGSTFHYAICETAFTSLIVNSGVRLEDSSIFPWTIDQSGPAWITRAYPHYLKRYGYNALRKFANLNPSQGWTPLCISASIGNMLMMKNIIDLGADVNLEGSPSGSAVMAACVAGQNECVKYLVRHGAWLTYHGRRGFRSVFAASNMNHDILDWLLVKRFIDQKQLSSESSGPFIREKDHESFTWGGPIKMGLVISGMMERLPNQSSQDYWSWLMKEKTGLNGKIPPFDMGQRTAWPTNLIPAETVRIHPGGYSTQKTYTQRSQSVPKLLFDGLLWYTNWTG